MNVLDYTECQVGFRPEKVHISRESHDAAFARTGKVLTREMLGSETQYKVLLDGVETPIMVKTADDSYVFEDNVVLSVEEEDLYFFNNEGARIRKGDVADFDKYIRIAGGKNNA